jgi:hypothetical protein
MKLHQLAISKKEFKKIIKKMPSHRCLLCGKKPYMLGILHPYGSSEFAKANRHLKVPYFLCFECTMDSDNSSERAGAIIMRALEDFKKSA